MIPKMWERINIKWRKSYIEGGSKLVGKKGQFSMGIFRHGTLPMAIEADLREKHWKKLPVQGIAQPS